MRPGVECPCCVSKVSRSEVLVAHRHPRVAMAENRHHRALRNTRHRERARRIVPQVMEAEILDAEPFNQSSERTGKHVGFTLRKYVGLRVEGAGKRLESMTQRVGQ